MSESEPQSTNFDLLLILRPNAGQFVNGMLDMADAVARYTELQKAISDKEIGENNTGSGEKTDNLGQSIKETSQGLDPNEKINVFYSEKNPWTMSSGTGSQVMLRKDSLKIVTDWKKNKGREVVKN
ncbi:MAG: hypothetical protein A2W85_14380 [Bacteroidetes bacterium GWF2_41_31]|nr:MAG: hypothetical protein A2W85_14380 [Bacteroidetes bacterium GWF2_41_31]